MWSSSVECVVLEGCVSKVFQKRFHGIFHGAPPRPACPSHTVPQGESSAMMDEMAAENLNDIMGAARRRRGSGLRCTKEQLIDHVVAHVLGAAGPALQTRPSHLHSFISCAARKKSPPQNLRPPHSTQRARVVRPKYAGLFFPGVLGLAKYILRSSLFFPRGPPRFYFRVL